MRTFILHLVSLLILNSELCMCSNYFEVILLFAVSKAVILGVCCLVAASLVSVGSFYGVNLVELVEKH